MKVLKGPFDTITQLLGLINNVATRASLHRFVAQHCAVFVDRHGKVVLLARIKGRVSSAAVSAIGKTECPGTAFFITQSGYFTSESELQKKIDECVEAYSIPPPSGQMEERVIDGKKVLILGARTKIDSH